MKKLLLALSCLSIGSAFADCEVYINNYVNFNETDNGTLNYTKFDVLYERFYHDSIPLTQLSHNFYGLGGNGDDFDCNTLNYHGSPAIAIKLQPYCKNSVDTQTFAKITRGGHLTMDCESGISLNIEKQYNNLINLAIVPTGFDNLTVRNFVPPKDESDGLSFITKNLNRITSVMNCTQSGKYYNCKPYTQELTLLFDHKLDQAQIEVFSAKNSKYSKIGECNINRVNNQPLVKCLTLPQYAKTYKVVAKGNTFITVIDPNDGK